MKTRVAGASRINEKLLKIRNKLVTDAHRIAVTPLTPIIRELKKQIKGTPQFNHMFTGRLYRNTRAELVSAQVVGDSGKIVVEFGFFVNYGLNLEKGGPKHDPGSNVMVNWARNKLRRRGRAPEAEVRRFARAVRKKIIISGSNAYNYVYQTWVTNNREYKADVLARLRKLFA